MPHVQEIVIPRYIRDVLDRAAIVLEVENSPRHLIARGDVRQSLGIVVLVAIPALEECIADRQTIGDIPDVVNLVLPIARKLEITGRIQFPVEGEPARTVKQDGRHARAQCKAVAGYGLDTRDAHPRSDQPGKLGRYRETVRSRLPPPVRV